VRKQQVVENVCAHAGLIELLKRGALIEHLYLDRYGRWMATRLEPYTSPAGFPEVSPSFREATGGGPSGGYADGWSRDPGFPAALGEPHPDAVAIAAAVTGLLVSAAAVILELIYELIYART